MTANVDIIVKNKEEVLKVKNSALSVNLKQKTKEDSGSGNRWGGGASQMQEIMGQLNMTNEQNNKMRGVYPKLGKVREAEKAIKPAVNHLIKNKCKKIILGCTELPIAIFAYKSFKKAKESKTFIDPNLLLAEICMKKYKST